MNAGVVARRRRRAPRGGHLVEGPLQGAELRGVPGLVEGAAEGRVRRGGGPRTSLALATDLADKPRGTDSARRRRRADEDENETGEHRGFPARVAGDGRRRDFAAPRAPPASASSRGGLTRASR